MHSFESPKFTEEKVIDSLRNKRKGKGLTQSGLAMKMNVSRDTVARFESGRSKVTFLQVIKIARILDISLGELILDEEKQDNLDSSLNLDSNISQSMSLDQLQWSNDNFYTQSQPRGQKINPFLSMGAVKQYGDKMGQFILSHKSLWWWVAEKELVHLSIASVVEAILNFGGDEDIVKLFKLVSMEKVSKIFKAANQGSRTNYKPEIVSYYNQYFKKHVPGYTH